MTPLHLISSPEGLAAALEVAGPEDGLLLIGAAASFCGRVEDRPVSVLEEDLPEGAASDAHVTCVDYAGFVALVAGHQPIITWR